MLYSEKNKNYWKIQNSVNYVRWTSGYHSNSTPYPRTVAEPRLLSLKQHNYITVDNPPNGSLDSEKLTTILGSSGRSGVWKAFCGLNLL